MVSTPTRRAALTALTATAVTAATATTADAAPANTPPYPYLFAGYFPYYRGQPVPAHIPGVPGDCTHLYYGSVRNIQRRIGATQDGLWGDITDRKVRDWQRAHNLKPDGIVGKLTAKAMGLRPIWA